LRFVNQKRCLQQNVTWRQYRKMFIQLMLVSITYLIFVIIFIVRQMEDLSGLTLVPSIIFPYAILLTLPDLKTQLYA
jgi:hypothetical protein